MKRIGKRVTVVFQEKGKEGVVYEKDEEIRRWPAEQLERERIVGLAVSRKKYVAKFGQGAQPSVVPPEDNPCVG